MMTDIFIAINITIIFKMIHDFHLITLFLCSVSLLEGGQCLVTVLNKLHHTLTISIWNLTFSLKLTLYKF